jgi:beta-lactamase superfamily II metal-dependent hydrolase
MASQLKISILDVGHGDFIYAETPFGERLVIDCGSGDVVPSKFLAPVTSITELQISHPHTDHFDDLPGLCAKTIQSFRCPPLQLFTDDVIGWRQSDAAKIGLLRRLQNAVPPNNAAVTTGSGFQHSVWGPTNVDYSNPNSASLVTVLGFGGFRMVFGGDLPDAGWRNLLAQRGFAACIEGTHILKVPHHGRAEGRSPALFDAMSPQLCVISDKPVDDDNVNTESTAWYTARSSGCNVTANGSVYQRKVLTTRNDGSIHIVAREDGTWLVYAGTAWK